jgi:hypothetical protein
VVSSPAGVVSSPAGVVSPPEGVVGVEVAGEDGTVCVVQSFVPPFHQAIFLSPMTAWFGPSGRSPCS